MYVLGSEIDYVEELGASFLKLVNPTATSSCGCGESFGV
jgi:iron-sulfur cluster insertion protein